METTSKIKSLLVILFFGTAAQVATSCNLNTHEPAEKNTAKDIGQYFSVKIDDKLWQAFPSKEFESYNLSYNEFEHQFSIFAEAEDGSRMRLSFHAPNELKVGNYPSTRNDYGILSGIFYYPEAKSSDLGTASTTMENPIQENTVQVTKIDKSNPSAYVIEGTFAPIMYAVYATNPKKTSKLTQGKFRVIYRVDAMHQAF